MSRLATTLGVLIFLFVVPPLLALRCAWPSDVGELLAEQAQPLGNPATLTGSVAAISGTAAQLASTGDIGVAAEATMQDARAKGAAIVGGLALDATGRTPGVRRARRSAEPSVNTERLVLRSESSRAGRGRSSELHHSPAAHRTTSASEGGGDHGVKPFPSIANHSSHDSVEMLSIALSTKRTTRANSNVLYPKRSRGKAVTKPLSARSHAATARNQIVAWRLAEYRLPRAATVPTTGSAVGELA
jgi:hypothetical protein